MRTRSFWEPRCFDSSRRASTCGRHRRLSSRARLRSRDRTSLPSFCPRRSDLLSLSQRAGSITTRVEDSSRLPWSDMGQSLTRAPSRSSPVASSAAAARTRAQHADRQRALSGRPAGRQVWSMVWRTTPGSSHPGPYTRATPGSLRRRERRIGSSLPISYIVTCRYIHVAYQ